MEGLRHNFHGMEVYNHSSHCENGSGYALALKGENILLGARILHIADVYDAMHSARPYRETPLIKEDIINIIKESSGILFDPKVVEVFERVIKRFDA